VKPPIRIAGPLVGRSATDRLGDPVEASPSFSSLELQMKSLKKTQTTKLSLNKTTVRHLSGVELAAVAGGLSNIFSDCRFCERQITSIDGNC
jgi:hypothetical protein